MDKLMTLAVNNFCTLLHFLTGIYFGIYVCHFCQVIVFFRTFNEKVSINWVEVSSSCSPPSFLFSRTNWSFSSRVLSSSALVRWSSCCLLRRSRWLCSYRATLSSKRALSSRLIFSRWSTRFCNSRAVPLALKIQKFVNKIRLKVKVSYKLKIVYSYRINYITP